MRTQSPGLQGLDDLAAMITFVRVVEAASFTAAARAMGTTTSAISKRIARLERRLGVRLLERTTRSQAPTEAGVAYYQRCARILGDLEEAELEVAQLAGEPRGLLRVNAQMTLGERHIAPLAGAFLARYPEVRLDLAANDRFASAGDDGFDVAVRLALDLTDAALVARRLAMTPLLVCGAPSYLERRGVPERPEDLLAHDCLHFSLMPIHREWTLWTRDGPRPVAVRARAQFDTAEALRQAALAGAGLIKIPALCVVDDLRSGALRSVLPAYNDRKIGVYALMPAARRDTPKVRAFVDFLAAELPPRLEASPTGGSR